MSRITRKQLILLSYPCMITVQFFYAALSGGIRVGIPYLLMLIVYGAFSFLALRGNGIAAWVMIASILVSGVGTVLVGVFVIAAAQAAIKATFILLGLYFIYGGIDLLFSQTGGKSLEK